MAEIAHWENHDSPAVLFLLTLFMKSKPRTMALIANTEYFLYMSHPIKPQRPFSLVTSCIAVIGFVLATACNHGGTTLRSIAVSTVDKPKLVVVLFVDQLRADHIQRYENSLLPAFSQQNEIGGFQYLKKIGAYYPLAEHRVLNALTAVGHSNVSTGAYPYRHGIIGNSWFENGVLTYSSGDPDSKWLDVNIPFFWGSSPKNLRGPTFSDTVKNSGFSSKVLSISIKDRAAILMGGHRADLALWFAKKDAKWTTSTYYANELPTWVQELNREVAKHAGKNLVWESAEHGSSLTPASGFRHETTLKGKGFLAFPLAVDLITNAAIRGLKAMNLGRQLAPDFLFVSFSPLDYVGHTYGPNSRELEESLKVSDRAIAKLLREIQRHMPRGLTAVQIVLVGDHGVSESPSYLKANKIPSGYIDQIKLTSDVNAHLEKKHGSPPSPHLAWTVGTKSLQIYLNRKAIHAASLDLAKVSREVRDFVSTMPGIRFAITQLDVATGNIPAGLYGEELSHSYVAERSGDVICIVEPFYLPSKSSTHHWSGYAYDRFVPLIIAGPRIKAGRYATPAETIDIAPTLAWILGVAPPALSEGRVLSEILAD